MEEKGSEGNIHNPTFCLLCLCHNADEYLKRDDPLNTDCWNPMNICIFCLTELVYHCNIKQKKNVLRELKHDESI